MSVLLVEAPVEVSSTTADDDDLLHYVCCADHFKAYCGTSISDIEWTPPGPTDDDCIVCDDLNRDRTAHCSTCATCDGCEACE